MTTTTPRPFVPLGTAGGFTVEDWLALPDDGQRVELVDGSFHVSPPPVKAHQRVANRLTDQLRGQLPTGLTTHLTGCGVATSDMSSHDGLIPDLLVTRDGTSVRDDLVDPSEVVLVVEVVSPSSRTRDRRDKRETYARWGIGAYWVVEVAPVVSVTVLRLVEGEYVEDAVVTGVHDVVQPFAVRLDVPALGA